jgi:hypothetical protein
MNGWWRAGASLLALTVMLLAGPGRALAQCAMCKAAIEASADAAAAASGLNLAALVLLIPPVAIFAGFFGLIYRYRNFQGGRKVPGATSR